MGLQIGRLIKAVRDAFVAVIVVGFLIAGLSWGIHEIGYTDFPIMTILFVFIGFVTLVTIFYDTEKP